MPAPFFQLIGHMSLAAHTIDEEPAIGEALVDEGLDESRLRKLDELTEVGLHLPDRRAEEVGDERIVDHAVHTSANEVEMWLETVAFKLKEAFDGDKLERRLDQTLGRGIHFEEHSIATTAQGLRAVGVLRTSEELREAIGRERQVQDVINRGLKLLGKLFDNGQLLMTPGHAGDPDAEVFDEIDRAIREMSDWLAAAEQPVRALADSDVEQVGRLGYVPEGVGLPVGGTGYSITLHERSRREPPDPDEPVEPDPSWTVGRQGQNRENLGGGWVEPTFKSQ